MLYTKEQVEEMLNSAINWTEYLAKDLDEDESLTSEDKQRIVKSSLESIPSKETKESDLKMLVQDSKEK